jgi:peptidoglycan/LPS O-acetylase OafA/YrhL
MSAAAASGTTALRHVSSASTDYRPDIDGLRAVAVLAVVVYHAVPRLCPGGFVGVDVFFVISGYLVTGILLKNRAKHAILDFYVRRAKRILPAHIFMLGVGTIAGYMLLTPPEYRAWGKLVAANASFASNFILLREANYFAPAAETQPLLHTWSLAVEEQFYLIWPLVLMWLLRSRRLLVPAVIVGIAASFALSCYYVYRAPAIAFYMLPTRAWELMVGGAAALHIIRAPRQPNVRDALGILGLALLLGSMAFLSQSSPFPGWNAAWPCFGAVLVIICGADETSACRRVLSWKPLVAVGLISYSLYLWHWLLLVFARLVNNAPLRDDVAALIIVMAALIATLSWRYIERPFRAPRSVPHARLLVRYSSAVGAMLALGVLLSISRGLPDRVPASVVNALEAANDVNPLQSQCLIDLNTRPAAFPSLRCVHVAGEAAPSLIVWGDSHANSLAPGVAAVARESGRSTYQATATTCPPLIGVRREGIGVAEVRCVEYNQVVLDGIKSRPELQTVVLAARWAIYSETIGFGDERGRAFGLRDAQTVAPADGDAKRVLQAALRRTVDELRAAGKTVLVIGQVPEVGLEVPVCAARNQMLASVHRECAVTRDISSARTRYVDELIEALDAPPQGVCAALPTRLLCSGPRCLSSLEGRPLYVDDDHLTKSGAEWLLRQFRRSPCL